MPQEQKMEWNSSVEQVDEAAEAKANEQYKGIPAEVLPGFAYDKIKEKIEAQLNNKYMEVAGAELEAYFELAGAPSVPIKVNFDAKKADFFGALQNELNQQIQEKNLKGTQEIQKFFVRIKTYEVVNKDGKEEKVNYGGGSQQLI